MRGIEARRLSADGLATDPATATRITTGDRYEGASVVCRRGWWYLMGSSTDCCRGPLTGYSVFGGRARARSGRSSTGWARAWTTAASAGRRCSP
jgi:arabinan endo-1,5-alpha-L-arabinosidase